MWKFTRSEVLRGHARQEAGPAFATHGRPGTEAVPKDWFADVTETEWSPERALGIEGCALVLVLDGCTRVWEAKKEIRYETLYRAAARAGQVLEFGRIDRTFAEDQLRVAADQVAQDAQRNVDVIRRGLDWGVAHPKAFRQRSGVASPRGWSK
jgi:hypothetical protein